MKTHSPAGSIFVKPGQYLAYSTLVMGSAIALMLYPHTATAVLSAQSANGVRRFGLMFGAIYTLVAIAGFAGMRDLGPIQLDLNAHFNFIHLGLGLLSLVAGVAGAKPAVAR